MMRSECFGRSSKSNSETNVSRHTFASPSPMHFNAKLRSICMLIPAPLTPCTAHPISGADAPALDEGSPLIATAAAEPPLQHRSLLCEGGARLLEFS